MEDDMLFTLSNYKTQKGEAQGWLTAILHLAPANEAGGRTVCPKSTHQCRELCLNTAGRGAMGTVQAARVRKTLEYLAHPHEFASRLCEEVVTLSKRAERQGLQLAVRVNGTSDLPKLAAEVAWLTSRARFYDYTKIPGVWLKSKYVHYTFSRSESNEQDCLGALRTGINVAVVFSTKKGEPLPLHWHHWPVIDGDVNDLRFLDPPGHVVGLRAKGRARRHRGGFVVPV